MKRAIAALITVALLAGVLVISRPATSPSSSEEDTPEDSAEVCIQRMFTAAEQGDVEAYLDCFTGPERERLDRELADQSNDVFARSLAETVGELKAHVVYAPANSQDTDNAVQLTVERVYLNRTEKQSYRLLREADRWRIHSVEMSQAYQPEKAYGTPVFEMPDSPP